MASRYVPAAGRAWLTRLYDPVLALTMREARWREELGRRARGRVVVDVGCGTGAQSLVLGALAGDGDRVLAVDGDPSVLSIAAAKAGAGSIDWRVGMADSLPVESSSADTVVMTLLLHHLDAAGKRGALREALRVLRAGGRLCVADWGRPRGVLPRLGARALRVVDGAVGLDDQLAGRLPAFIAAAGFDAPQGRGRVATVWGTLDLLTTARP
jgi:ubiquinone/menaquinone biosynthesis C-methylase UbiE